MTIRKGMCPGCPWNYGDPSTEMAYNLGCLPSIHEATKWSKEQDKSWACHSEPDKVCCGFAAQEKDFPKNLLIIRGIHCALEAQLE